MSREFSRVRSEAIRSMLVDAVELAPHRSPSYRTRSYLAAAGLVVAGLVVGGAVSAAAVTAGFASQIANEPIGDSPAPDGVIPGAPVITLRGEPLSQLVTGSATVTLPKPPTGATHVRVAVSCLTAGTTTWGLDAGGNNPGSVCTDSDVREPQAAYFDFALSGDDVLSIHADADDSSMVTYQYVTHVETDWGVNANGDTFGVVKQDGATPDLVYAIGFDPSNEPLEGYVWATDLEGPQPTSPAQALESQEEQGAEGWDVPLYLSDGKTQIGLFHVGA